MVKWADKVNPKEMEKYWEKWQSKEHSREAALLQTTCRIYIHIQENNHVLATVLRKKNNIGFNIHALFFGMHLLPKS